MTYFFPRYFFPKRIAHVAPLNKLATIILVVCLRNCRDSRIIEHTVIQHHLLDRRLDGRLC
jgi:hypothetical protein